MVKLKELSTQELYGPGHRLCAGCGPSISVRMMLKAIRGPTVGVNATGCIEVGTSIFPYSAWKVPWVHTAFENAAAVASGIESAFKALAKKGIYKEKIDVRA
jgi:pyruvate ferredoxin oxidoreductase beta subunit